MSMENLQPSNNENSAEKQEGMIVGFINHEREQIGELLKKIPTDSKVFKTARSLAAGLALMSGAVGCSTMHDLSEAERHNQLNHMVSYGYYSTNENIAIGGGANLGGVGIARFSSSTTSQSYYEENGIFGRNHSDHHDQHTNGQVTGNHAGPGGRQPGSPGPSHPRK